MLISDGITAMKACLEMFGDVHFNFCTTEQGNPALELKNVDTTLNSQLSTLNSEEEILRFNARFPTKDIFIPSRN